MDCVLSDRISLAELLLNGLSAERKVFLISEEKNEPTKDLCTASQCSYEVGHLGWGLL